MRGREYSDDATVKVPGEIDAQRARQILKELRKRYGESYRPQIELDYIERLLKGLLISLSMKAGLAGLRRAGGLFGGVLRGHEAHQHILGVGRRRCELAAEIELCAGVEHACAFGAVDHV